MVNLNRFTQRGGSWIGGSDIWVAAEIVDTEPRTRHTVRNHVNARVGSSVLNRTNRMI